MLAGAVVSEPTRAAPDGTIVATRPSCSRTPSSHEHRLLHQSSFSPGTAISSFLPKSLMLLT